MPIFSVSDREVFEEMIEAISCCTAITEMAFDVEKDIPFSEMKYGAPFDYLNSNRWSSLERADYYDFEF